MIILRQKFFASKEDKENDKDTYPLFTKNIGKT